MKRYVPLSVVILCSLLGVFLFQEARAASLGTTASSTGLDGSNNFIYNLGGLSIGTTTKTAGTLIVGSGGIVFPSGTQTTPYLGTSQTVSASNVSQGVFGYPNASNSYAFPAALGIGTTNYAGLPTNGLYVAGNVGIGTTSPGYKLDVQGGDIRVSGNLGVGNAPPSSMGGTSGYGIGLPSTTNDFIRIIGEHDGGDTSNGIFLTGDNTSDGWIFRESDCCGAGTLNYMRIARNGVWYVGEGNFGIGTTSPGAPLEISSSNTNTNIILKRTPNPDQILTIKSPGSGINAEIASAYGLTISSGASGQHIILSPSGNVGIGTTSPTAKLQVNGTYYSPIVIKGNCSGAVTIDWSAGNTQHCVLTGNVTFTFSNPQSGANYKLILKQDGTGSRTVTWPANVRWGSLGVPNLSVVPAKTDYVGFIYNGVDSTYDGVAFNSNF